MHIRPIPHPHPYLIWPSFCFFFSNYISLLLSYSRFCLLLISARGPIVCQRAVIYLR